MKPDISAIPRILAFVLCLTAILLFGADSHFRQSLSPASAEGFPVTVGGAPLDNPPQRVIAFSPAVYDIVTELGYKDRIIGKCEGAEGDCPAFGTLFLPDLEAISASDADLIIVCGELPVSFFAELAKREIKLCVLDVPTTLDELQQLYTSLAAIFCGTDGASKMAETLLLPLHDNLAEAENTGLSLALILSEAPAVATGDTIGGELLQRFGQNVAQAATDYAFPTETLLSSPPDFLFISSDIDTSKLPEGILRDGHYAIISTECLEQPTSALIELTDEIAAELEDYSN